MPLRVFEVETYKVGVYLSELDMQFVMRKMEPQQKVRFDPLIKDLNVYFDPETGEA